MKNENEENESGKLHPFDNENFATAGAKAHESGKWMAALFYIKDGKVSSHLTTNDFPQADFVLVEELIKKDIKNVHQYKISTTMPDLANIQHPELGAEAFDETVEEEAAADVEDEDKAVADEFGFPSDAMRLMRKK